jgi:bacteriorhodopsin
MYSTRETNQLAVAAFYYVFYIMIFAFIVSILSSIIVEDFSLRKILFLQIIVTGVSSFMYYLFTKNISLQKQNGHIDFKQISILRYNGWCVTTPIMLIALCFALSNSTHIPIPIGTLLYIIALDYLMLLFGYLGEIGVSHRIVSTVLGFLPFFLIFYIIFSIFMGGKFNFFNYLIFGIYFFIWTGYGISYLLQDNLKNFFMNIFDCISKAGVALILSGSYTLLN